MSSSRATAPALTSGSSTGSACNGVVRVSDHPATGRSRVFLVERGLEQDGYGALQALVADYMRESVRRDEPAILVNLDQLAAGL